MIELGKKQELTVIKKTDFGIYLGEGTGAAERVLLPKKQVPEGTAAGDKLTVFVYRDSKDRLICTTQEPKVQLGGLAVLKVVQVGKIGAFLDWGLEKDLLLPFRQQTRRVREGDQVLAALYIDKSSRLCATMNVYEYLETQSPYQKEDRVRGTVYEISREFGAFVAVDNRYSGLIPRKDFHGDASIGDVVEARVTAVHEDGKLDLSIREKAYLQMDQDAQTVLKVIDEFDGVLPFNDKASPEVIERELKLSKNAFKFIGIFYRHFTLSQFTGDFRIRSLIGFNSHIFFARIVRFGIKALRILITVIRISLYGIGLPGRKQQPVFRIDVLPFIGMFHVCTFLIVHINGNLFRSGYIGTGHSLVNIHRSELQITISFDTFVQIGLAGA